MLSKRRSAQVTTSPASRLSGSFARVLDLLDEGNRRKSPTVPTNESGMESTAGEPSSIATQWWKAIAQGRADVAADLAARLAVPEVTNTFTFDDDEAGLTDEDGGVGGTFEVIKTAADTPANTLSYWNHTAEVGLIQVQAGGGLCLATISSQGKVDFRACVRMSPPHGSAIDQCTVSGHLDSAPKKPRRMIVEDDGLGVFAIRVPVLGKSVKQSSCFSRPVFRLDDFPIELRQMDRHVLLLRMLNRPRVWRFLFFSYPGRGELLRAITAQIPAALSGLPQVRAQSETKMEQGKEKLVEVEEPPGLAALLADFGKAAMAGGSVRSLHQPSRSSLAGSRSGSQRDAHSVPLPGDAPREDGSNKKFAWEQPVEQVSISKDDGGLSVGLASSAESEVVREFIRSLSHQVKQLEDREQARDDSLGRVIGHLRRENESLQLENKSLSRRLVDLELDVDNINNRQSTSSFAAGLAGGGSHPDPHPLTAADRATIANEIISGLSLDQFIKETDLNNRRYVDEDRLQRLIPTPTVLPPRLDVRLNEMERMVLHPGGRIDQLEARFKNLEDAKQSESIGIAGYVFKDQQAVDAFMAGLPKESFRHCADMKVQLFDLQEKYSTVQDGLKTKSDVSRANYDTIEAAVVGISFDIVHPEVVIRRTSKASDAEQEGFVFTPAFCSARIFEGTLTHGTYTRLKKEVATNRDRRQRELNYEFPPDQTQTVMVHAVFSDILRRGYYQLCSWLDSFLPFNATLVKAGIPESVAWNEKILTYIKSVDEKVQQVRTVTKSPSPGAMVMGMFKATKMLDRYAELDFVSHPDVAMCLVVSSLEREGISAAVFQSQVDSVKKSISDAERSAKRVEDDMKKLKTKNPELFR